MTVICSIGLYPILTILLEVWYLENRDSKIATYCPFDTFRVYQKAFSKECIIPFLLLHVLIVVLSLLPDFSLIVVKFIQESFRMVRYRYADTTNSAKDFNNAQIQNTNLTFGDRMEKSTTLGDDCRLERFQQLNINEREVNSQSQKPKNIVLNERHETNPHTAYTNPSFEGDIRLQKLS